MNAEPKCRSLSVVVTIVDGQAATVACLAALGAQVGGPDLEILVPFDESIAWARRLAAPGIRPIPMGHLTT
ncbi:MAG: hypothetical protein KDB53_04105, partial [Planctomycetes bacterium]|nr:hypothetical protein [Planctomycetota bacterium]